MQRNPRPQATLLHWQFAGIAIVSAALVSTCAFGQSASGPVIIESGGATFQVQPGGAVQPSPGAQPPANQAQPTEEAKEGEGEKKEGEKKEGDEKKEGKEENETSEVKRPDTPPKLADPRELEAKPNAAGKVSFDFNGQMWPDVLQWLANVSNYSLDWTELPSGYLNLSTQRPYTLAEARDLINRQLHARGYTMILTGEVLSVFKIDKLDPSLIPRVEEEDLYDLQPHDFVKITFQLPESMEVAAAAEDVKKAASEHAKVIPLPATKRILMISTVANARLVSVILNEERLAAAGEQRPEEIALKYRRAEKLIDTLYVVLGLDPASQPSQQELAVQQQKMQLLMQMQGAGKDVSKMLQSEGPPVHLAFNSHRNSIIANAPPRELRIIKRTIEMLDVPAGSSPPDLASLDSGTRIARSYRLETVEPTALLSTLEEIGDLSPLTELRADNKADILFARASEVDHEKIEKMVEQLDEPGMETRVFQLRKHPADAVAGTLRNMFAPKKDEDDSRSRRDRYSWMFGYGNEEEEEPAPDVRIDADIENNRLIVRGTPDELEQIRDMLTKLGEPLDETIQGSRLRVVEAFAPEETARLLQQLRRVWPSVGDNELLIEGPEMLSDPAQPESKPTPNEPPADREARRAPSDAGVFRFAAESAGPSESASAASTAPSDDGQEARASNEKPPVVIRIAPDGRLMLSSEDTAALDRLEELIESAAPARERFEIIPIEYVTASSIYLTLDLLYKEEQQGEETEGYFDPWYYEYIPGDSSSSSPQLSQRKKLYFDYDIATNTILVANASPSQLREIKTLIAAYDQPSRDEDAKSRRTVAIKIKYSRANVIATALKDVYRDLLSQRDKEFETDEKKGGGTAKETTTIIRYGRSGSDGEDGPKRPTPVKVGFQGALSVGVDEISNTIIVSVQEELLESVLQIVESLDEAAKPQTTVAVHSVGSNISPEAMQKALAEALGTPWVGGKPEKREQAKPEVEGEGGPQGGQPPGGRGGAAGGAQPASE